MVDICPNCGNYGWDKAVAESKISCPKCGQSSVDYNRYFMEHESIGGVPFEALDVTGLTVNGAAAAAGRWIRGRME